MRVKIAISPHKSSFADKTNVMGEANSARLAHPIISSENPNRRSRAVVLDGSGSPYSPQIVESATAPLVGSHRKTKSRVQYDPYDKNKTGGSSCPSTPSCVREGEDCRTPGTTPSSRDQPTDRARITIPRSQTSTGECTPVEEPKNHSTSSMIKDLCEVMADQQKREHELRLLALPSLTKVSPTSFLTGRERVHSYDMEPSQFQIEIPALSDLLESARLVHFVDEYHTTDTHFDLNLSLAGRSRLELRRFVIEDQKLPHLCPTNHSPIVKALLDAASDVIIHSSATASCNNNTDVDEQREMVIFERQRQFVVAFRGTAAEQHGKSPFFKSKVQAEMESVDIANLPVQAFAGIKKAYAAFEDRLVRTFDRLIDENPFCDVVFCGASFGGAMALMGAIRFADSRPMVRVHCHTFGSPKVGSYALRDQAGCLPNLNITRVEHQDDTKCTKPTHDNGARAGHCIVLNEKNIVDDSNQTLLPAAEAYKFDQGYREHRCSSRNSPLFSAKTKKKERSMASYVGSLEEIQRKNLAWVKDYVGEDGEGVRGSDDEARYIV